MLLVRPVAVEIIQRGLDSLRSARLGYSFERGGFLFVESNIVLTSCKLVEQCKR